MVASLAASAGDGRWILFNATSDVRRQIESFEGLLPRPPRASPIDAILLTDANVDHAFGLTEFRQAERLRVYSTTTIRDVLAGANSAFVPFTRGGREWTCVDEGDVGVKDAEGRPFALRVQAIGVRGLTPSFDGSRAIAGAAVAYAVRDAAGARLLYAPIFARIEGALERELREADAAFLDGSFWTDDELQTLGLGSRTAREMGHLPISGPDGSLEVVRRHSSPRRYYTHLNNTNPVLDPRSPAAQTVRDAGLKVAEDGMELVLDPADAVR